MQIQETETNREVEQGQVAVMKRVGRPVEVGDERFESEFEPQSRRAWYYRAKRVVDIHKCWICERCGAS